MKWGNVGSTLSGAQVTEQYRQHGALSLRRAGQAHRRHQGNLQELQVTKDGDHPDGLWGEAQASTCFLKIQGEHRELYSMLCGDLDGKKFQRRGDISLCIANSLCCTEENNTML